MATVLTKYDDKRALTASTTSLNSNPPLGVPVQEKRFWFQRTKSYDPDAIATLVSSTVV